MRFPELFRHLRALVDIPARISNRLRRSRPTLDRAIAAHRSKNWSEAALLWRTYIGEEPSDYRGYYYLGSAALAMGRTQEAATNARLLEQRFPDRVEGALLSMRAADIADRSTKIAGWRQVITRFPSSAAALEELGRALLPTELEEARGIVRALDPIDRRAAVRLHIAIEAATGEREALAGALKRAVKEFPDSSDFRRMAIDAQLRAGSIEAAENLQTLIRSREARATDVNLVIGLANAYRLERNTPRIKPLVRSYLKSFGHAPERRLAALKLSRTIFSEFSCVPAAHDHLLDHYETMIRKSPASAPAKAWLLDTCAQYRKAKKIAPASLLETDILRAQCENFVALVREHLAASKPFSLIRLGDGEAQALPYETGLQAWQSADAAEREQSWWGKTLEESGRQAISRQVSEAIHEANALGIPCAGRVLRDIDLQKEEVLSGGRSGRGLRAVMQTFASMLDERDSKRLFVSFAIHRDLQNHDLYRALFTGVPDILCISPHADLPDALMAKFGALSARNITIRSAYASRDKIASDTRALVLPDQRDAVVSAMGDDLKGRLVVVAAGYIGKWFVHEAAKRGAVALDLGSIPDHWAAKRTRSYLDI